jgi:hypothetical protein
MKTRKICLILDITVWVGATTFGHSQPLLPPLRAVSLQRQSEKNSRQAAPAAGPIFDMPLPVPPTLLHACICGCSWFVATSLLTRFPVLSSITPARHRAPACRAFAHRGAAPGAAENTLQAFQAAINQVIAAKAAAAVIRVCRALLNPFAFLFRAATPWSWTSV